MRPCYGWLEAFPPGILEDAGASGRYLYSGPDGGHRTS
jgi:hypothetical protein